MVVDASPVGLGAVLLQEDENGDRSIIAYASKALSVIEKKYYQTEREALAIVWAVEKFHLYLFGIKFDLFIDCKALEFLFQPRSKPCLRLERWILRLQSYDFTVKHLKDNTENIL